MRSHYIDAETRSIISLSPPMEQFPGWTINRVSVLPPHRGRGLARKLMSEVLFDADMERVRLYLEVQPDGSPGSLSFEQLQGWYTRLGFKNSRLGYPVMARTPSLYRNSLAKEVHPQQVRGRLR